MTVREMYEIIGGDYEDLLSRVFSDDLAERFIKMYAETKDVDAMVEAFEKKDYRTVFELSHGLKGMTGNMSLKRNSETIVAICESVRHGDPTEDISGLIEKAKKEHEELLSLIKQLP